MGDDKRFLVTGAGGQLGKALARLVHDATFLNHRALDVTAAETVVEAIKDLRPQVIIHAAAYTKVDAAEADEKGAHAVNALGTQAVAAAAQAVDAVLAYPSTDYVFDGKKDSPYREDDEVAPLSVYGRTKLEGEKFAAKVSKHVIVRTSWVFGEGSNFIRTIVDASKKHDVLTVVDDQRGLPTYALDLGRGILDLLSGGATGIVHLAGGGPPATWADLAELALELTGSKARVKRVSTDEYYSGRSAVAPRPSNSVLDCSKAESLGVTLRPWREAVAEYIETIR